MKKRISIVLGISTVILLLAVFFMQNNNDQSQSLSIHNQHIQVASIKLGMSEQEVFEQLKVKPEEEMCVYGYEFNFKDEGLNLGFRVDTNTIRRITVINNTDTLYGIKNGMTLDEAKQVLLDAGFMSDETVKNRYKIDDVYFTVVSKKGTHVDQLIIEIIDDKILEYAQ